VRLGAPFTSQSPKYNLALSGQVELLC
jgi:hypothetical protein